MRNRHTANRAVLDILSQDPVWAAYAIADLRPDLTPHCQWHVAPDASGLALVFSGLQPPVLLTAGSPQGVAAALTGAALPEEVFLSVLPSHMPAVKQRYRHIAPHDMVRMVLPQGAPVPAPATAAHRLSHTDASRLTALYQHEGEYAPDAFDPSQLDDGFFFGIEDSDGMLAAAGGTHVAHRGKRRPLADANLNSTNGSSSISKIISQGVAAIGNIYTRPDCRGKGYAKAISTSIAGALRNDGFSLIVLNVDKRNLVARSLYEKLGFDVHCHFIEGFASNIQVSNLNI